MSEAKPKPDPDALLAHRDFVRGLAMKLVFDKHAADDIVQETWLAALQNAPAQPRSMRAWLARVARNLALKSARTDIRRRQRERREARPVATPSTLDTVERIARERRVIDAVLALDEPYRTTLLLRFYDDLPPREIAKRMDANGATVRTRLKRGLAMLRARFDNESGSSRTWMLSLLPLLVPTVTTAGTAATTGGILLMSAKKTLAATAAIVAILLGVLAWSIGTPDGEERAQRARAHVPAAAGPAPAPPQESDEQVAFPIPSVPLTVRVVDGQGEPVSGARVERFPQHHMTVGVSYTPDWYAIGREQAASASATTDATGRARFEFPLESTARFVAHKRGLSRGGSRVVMVRTERDAREVEIVLAPGRSLEGRVVDGDGHPVAGAIVLAGEASFQWDWLSHARPARTLTDDKGRYRFHDLPARDVALFAGHPRSVPFHIRTIDFPAVARYDIVLRRGGRLHGRVTDADSGTPIAHARVRVVGYFQHRAEATTDRDGRYVIESLPPTVLNSIDAIVPGYYHVRTAADDKTLSIRLDAGDVCERDLSVRRAPRLHGTVRGPDGPLADVVVQSMQWGSMREGWMAETRTSPDGTYALAMRPGRHALAIGTMRLQIEGYVFTSDLKRATGKEPWIVDMPERGELRRDLTLVDNRMFVGACSAAGVARDADGAPLAGVRIRIGMNATISDAEGRFQVSNLPAGRQFVMADLPGWFQPKPLTVLLSPNAPRSGVDVRMHRAASLSGVVRGDSLDAPFVLMAVAPSSSGQSGALQRETELAKMWSRARRIPVSSDGTFRIDDVPATRGLLLRAGALNAASSDAVPIKPGGRYEFTLDSGARLAGRIVIDGEGAPIAGAEITVKTAPESATGPYANWFNDRDQTVVAVSDADGRFELRHRRGEYLMRAAAAGHIQSAPVRVRAGDRQIVIRLAPDVAIRGTVLFADGKPGVALRVLAETTDKSHRSRATETSQQGAFSVTGLRPGRYRLTVGGLGARTRTVGPFEVGRTDVEIRVERAGPGEGEEWPTPQEGSGEIRGRVRDPSGSGLVGYRIWAVKAGSPKNLLGNRVAISGAGGVFAIRGLGDGSYRIRASAPGTLLLIDKEGVQAGARDLEFVFDSITGVLVDDAGKPLNARRIRAIHTLDPSRSRDVYTEADGSFRIEGLIPAKYRLILKRASRKTPDARLSPATTKSGIADLRLVASTGAEITGVVADERGTPLKDVMVSVRVGSHQHTDRTGEDGRFRISGLEQGRDYEVQVRARKFVGTAKKSVPGGTTGLRFVLSTGFEASGRLLDGSGNGVDRVDLRSAPKGSDLWAYAKTDANGAFTLHALHAGENIVEAFRSTGDGVRWVVVGSVRSGETSANLQLP